MKLKSKLKTKTFRDFLSAIPNGFEEARIKITNKGFSLDSMDSARVLMSKIHIGNDIFDSYSIDGEFEITFDVMRIKHFVNTLRASAIDITVEEDKNIILKADAMVYDLRLFNTLDRKSLSGIPEFEFDDIISLSTKDFKTYMEAANKIGMETVLGLEKGDFFVIAKTKSDKVVVKIPKDKMNALDGEHQIDLKSSFGTSYLLSVSNAVRFLDNIKLNLKNGSILRIDGGHDGIEVEYLLAPLRIK